MPVTLWLVRHGQTDWNVEGRFQGQADPPLNAVGRAESRRLAAQLRGRHIDALYSSDLRRARQTAAYLSRAMDKPIRLEPRLREINQGQWEGMLFTDISRQFPEISQVRQRNALDFRPPGGETVREVAARVLQAVDDIGHCHPGSQVIVVSHGVALAVILAVVNHVPWMDVFSLIPPNAGFLAVEWTASPPGVLDG
jgi:broad specificity phosphatase PhoE